MGFHVSVYSFCNIFRVLRVFFVLYPVLIETEKKLPKLLKGQVVFMD